MACISKLASAIAYDCDTGATGLVSALIINKADIASFNVDPSGAVTTLTLVSGARAYKIDAVKRSLVLSSALKVNDGAPNAYAHSANITVMNGITGGTYSGISRALSNGSFVILARPVGTNHAIARGLYYGMSATAFDQSSHENGSWATATIETPENVIGEDNLIMPQSVYDALYVTAVE